MSESLDRALEEKFRRHTDAQLIERMELAEDFGYDDESAELDRRLKLGGLAWKWTQINGRDRAEVYRPEAGDAN